MFIFMFIVFADVTGRYLFIMPLPGTLEIGEAVLVFVVFLSSTYVLINRGHVRVTLLTDRLSDSWQAWLDILAFALGFVLMLLMAWKSLPFAMSSYKLGETGLAFPLPLYPAKFAFFAGSALLCIGFFTQFINHLFAKLENKVPAGGEKS
jgi:TRAP-type C4-dicarboxylate transport system permease small subunit